VRLDGAVQTAPGGSNKILVLREPIGVSLLVTPWNFPGAMAARKIAPALAAGCAVILKPAPETPLTALTMHALLGAAGVPDGVVNLVPSSRSGEMISASLDHELVRKISVTGSTEVGRTLLGQAARTVVSASMELGGNAPFLVLSDADVVSAVEGALVARFRNGGSACAAANRFLVHSSRVSEITDRLAAAVARLRIGPGLDDATDIGPLVREKARSKVAELVGGAIEDGAQVLVGGSTPDRPAYCFEPTLQAGVPHDARILSEEIFGPVAPVLSFDDDDKAVVLANRTEYGLVSCLYTSDQRRGMRVAARLEAGMIGLNRPVVSDPAAPFGGTKQSGIGREGGHEGILAFTECKYVAVDW
jgi:succinate-semialdehyde dehydrogenase/glutarate-semialdehyde dehydrogenase